jgi:hypothetical protein
MSQSPAEIEAVAALVDMSLTTFSNSSDANVILELYPSFSAASSDFTTPVNNLPATPVSLSSNQDGSVTTDRARSADWFAEAITDESIPPGVPDLRRETYLQTNATLLASPTPSIPDNHYLVYPPSNYHFNGARATSPVLVERAIALPSPDIRRRVEDYSHGQVRERDLANIMEPAEPEPCGRFGFNQASYGYYSPSTVSFSDLPGRGTANSPYYVNTPPPGAEEVADRGSFFAEVIQEQTVRTGRRRVKALFIEYFHLLDTFPYCSAARTGGRRRTARQWLYREVMDEIDVILADFDEVTMQMVN